MDQAERDTAQNVLSLLPDDQVDPTQPENMARTVAEMAAFAQEGQVEGVLNFIRGIYAPVAGHEELPAIHREAAARAAPPMNFGFLPGEPELLEDVLRALRTELGYLLIVWRKNDPHTGRPMVLPKRRLVMGDNNSLTEADVDHLVWQLFAPTVDDGGATKENVVKWFRNQGVTILPTSVAADAAYARQLEEAERAAERAAQQAQNDADAAYARQLEEAERAAQQAQHNANAAFVVEEDARPAAAAAAAGAPTKYSVFTALTPAQEQVVISALKALAAQQGRDDLRELADVAQYAGALGDEVWDSLREQNPGLGAIPHQDVLNHFGIVDGGLYEALAAFLPKCPVIDTSRLTERQLRDQMQRYAENLSLQQEYCARFLAFVRSYALRGNNDPMQAHQTAIQGSNIHPEIVRQVLKNHLMIF